MNEDSCMRYRIRIKSLALNYLHKYFYRHGCTLWCTVILLLLLTNFKVQAQINKSIPLIKGQQLFKKTISNSTTKISHGDQSLDLETNLFYTQLFTLEDISANQYSFVITTQKIVDTLNLPDQRVVYNSEILNDSNALFEKSINALIRQTIRLNTDSMGVILSVKSDSVKFTPDPLVRFVGLLPQEFFAGNTLEFFKNFGLNNGSEKGYRWVDSSKTETGKTLTAYKVESKTGTVTSVQFTRSITDSLYNTNTNGEMLIDNKQGMILEKTTKTITVENQWLNGNEYRVIRRRAQSESYEKL